MVLNYSKCLIRCFDLCIKFFYNKIKKSVKEFVLVFSVFLFLGYNVLGL